MIAFVITLEDSFFGGGKRTIFRGDQLLQRTIQEEYFAVHPKQLYIFFPQDSAAAGGDDAAVFAGKFPDDVCFQIPEGKFSLGLNDLRRMYTGFFLDQKIGIQVGPIKRLRQKLAKMASIPQTGQS